MSHGTRDALIRLARLVMLVAGLLLLVPPPAPAAGGVEGITLDPALVKGPPGAPVTIVEFSDYE